MSKQLRITVTENDEVIARFDSTDDAMIFAEAITASGERTVHLADRAGWVELTYTNGHTTDIR